MKIYMRIVSELKVALKVFGRQVKMFLLRVEEGRNDGCSCLPYRWGSQQLPHLQGSHSNQLPTLGYISASSILGHILQKVKKIPLGYLC